MLSVSPSPALVRFLPQLANQGGYHVSWEKAISAWDVLLDHPAEVPAEVLVRLGKVMASPGTRITSFIAAQIPQFQAAAMANQPPFSPTPWLDELLRIGVAKPREYTGRPFEASRLSAELVERLLGANGQPPDLIYRDVFPRRKYDLNSMHAMGRYGGLCGYGSRLALRPDIVNAALTDPSTHVRALALGLFETLSIPIGAYRDRIATMAVDSAKSVREAAASLIIKAGDEMLPAIRPVAESGKPAERALALRLIARLGSAEGKLYLQERSSRETHAKVRAVLEELLGQKGSAEPEANEVLSDFDVFAGIALGDDTRLAMAVWAKGVSHQELDEAFRWLVQPTAWESDPPRILEEPAKSDVDGLKLLLRGPKLTPLHLVRLLRLAGLLQVSPHDTLKGHLDLSIPAQLLERLFAAYRDSHGPRMGLRELAAAFRGSALDENLIEHSRFLHPYHRRFDWDDSSTWPYFAARLDFLAKELDPPARAPLDWGTGLLSSAVRRQQALAVIAAFPSPPARFVPRLWEIALGKSESDRSLAQRSLEKLPDCGERLLKALSGGKAQERKATAEWIARLRPDGAVEALQAAFQAERSAPVQTALAEALRALGATNPQDQQPGEDARESLRHEAAKALKGGIPAKYAWFPFDEFPEVRWRSDLTPVERPVLTGLIVSAWKTKSAEPTVILRDQVDLIHEDDRKRLGKFVIDAWFAEDLRPAGPEELIKRMGTLLKWTGASTIDEIALKNPDLAQAVEFEKNRPMSTRPEDKGILALVAACGPRDVVEHIRSYVNQWYGYRVAQCRALIQVLAWIDNPEAVAFLLDVAKRFRTASIRQEAETQVRKLAERKGVTLAELADTSLPDAGLDAEGKLVLDFGPRKFIARLDDDAEIVLEDAAGNVLKALPSPGKSDDAELAAAAKKRFAALKKDLKTIRKRVVDRLHEAMCTQRSWTFADWKATLLGHPIAGRLCQRVIWTVKEAAGPAATIRPLEDGTLTDLDDNEVQPSADATVRIAHRMLLPYKTIARWAVHMADFDVDPLLSQFERPFRLPTGSKSETSLSLPLDPPLAVQPLTNRARGRGYDPLAFRLEDGGDCFVKHFPGAQLRAEIRITDLDAKEKATGLDLHFLRADAGKDSRASLSVPLGEIPPVLLSECHADLLGVGGSAGGAAPEEENV